MPRPARRPDPSRQPACAGLSSTSVAFAAAGGPSSPGQTSRIPPLAEISPQSATPFRLATRSAVIALLNRGRPRPSTAIELRRKASPRMLRLLTHIASTGRKPDDYRQSSRSSLWVVLPAPTDDQRQARALPPSPTFALSGFSWGSATMSSDSRRLQLSATAMAKASA